jgi:hypothetical protein
MLSVAERFIFGEAAPAKRYYRPARKLVGLSFCVINFEFSFNPNRTIVNHCYLSWHAGIVPFRTLYRPGPAPQAASYNSAMRWLCLLFAVQAAFAQPARESDIPHELLVLSRIKARMKDNLEKLPNYTCTQTILRSQRAGASRRFHLVDTLRLEVALVGGKELFSWPGERSFEERDLRQLVGSGTIGNGDFALHARAVFLSNTATFEYVGAESLDSRSTIRFNYEVPINLSGYQLRVGDISGVAGYRGSFWVDAQTLDLVRLEVHSTVIPPHVPIRSASNILQYARVPIGSEDFLLPKESELILVDLHGGEHRNQIRFNNCRQYTGESTLVFDDPPPDEAVPAQAIEDFDVAEGLLIQVQLKNPIDLASAAVGDPFAAVLVRDVKVRKEVVLPKNATMTGRISYLSRRSSTSTYYLVAFEPLMIEFPGKRGRLRAVLEEARPFRAIASLSGSLPLGLPRRIELPPVTRNLFVVPGAARRLAPDFFMEWRTQSLSRNQEKQ